jgi:4-alpha-glucanotransferase
VLQALGAPLGRPEDAAGALRRRRQEVWGRGLEPVAVAWDGLPPELTFRLPARDLDRPHRCALALENGTTYNWTMKPSELPAAEEADVEGVRYAARRMHLIGPYPLGYHRLTVERDGAASECVLIAAPVQPAEAGRAGKTWGVFLPLYALHGKQSWGAGDFGDLEDLVGWVQSKGGGLVATLPMLAAFLDEPYEPSPYSPVSRLFWNEFYVSVERCPEFQRSARARGLAASREAQDELRAQRAAPLVDYRRQMAMKRRVLEECARGLFAEPSARRDALLAHAEAEPRLRDYAAFRAACDRRRAAWQTWPAPLRDGALSESDYDPQAQRYHMYVQWLADEQLQGLAGKARSSGPGLYLDLPVGVNAAGYDVWRHRRLFAADTAAGAPPDPFFSKGQNWGFPPLHPETVREGGYPYVRDFLRHHLRLSGILRIDHMMGLHRMFWIPYGVDARDGLYVGYRADEMYAVFNLEAHRHGSVLVGEDLGTVPPEVPQMMARHKVHRMYILQYRGRPDPNNGLEPIFEGAVASFGTHDMPTFAAFWQGLDIQDRVDLGVLDEAGATEERRRRRELCQAVEAYLQKRGFLQKPGDLAAVLRACLAYLSTGPGRVALANLEDLWLEVNPQNVPGTWRERPNWQRRARHSLEEVKELAPVLDALRDMDRIVKQGR